MPSSPSFNDHKRGPTERFYYRGVSLLPPDSLGPGKVAYARNVRSYSEGEVTVRDGRRRLTSGAMNGPVNSTFRLNDPALLAGGDAAVRFHGTEAGGLYTVLPNAGASVAPSLIDSGYGDDPISGVVGMPVGSPQPWAYCYGLDRMRKVNAAQQVRSIGLPPPANPGVARLAQPQTTFLEDIAGGGWTSYGPDASAVDTTNPRIAGAVVNFIVYDEGATGMCSVYLDDMTGIAEGATVEIGGAAETVIVQEVIAAVSPTTIAAILYDQGNSGFCTIQPEGSFGLGQLEVASRAEIAKRYRDLDQPLGGQPVTISRPVDYPVRGVVMLNGLEAVQIQSVAVGTDGVLSFRCFTAGTFGAGDTITGSPVFRCYTVGTVSLGDPVTAPAAQNVVTPVDADTPAYAGIQVGFAAIDWSQVGDRAMQPEDLITFSINISRLAPVEFVRLLLASNDGAAAGEEFTQNYYQYDWRANDLVRAVQAALETADVEAVETMLEAQERAVQSGQAETFYEQGFGTEPLLVTGANNTPVGFGEQPGRTDGFITAGTSPSRQLGLGNGQWFMLRCRVGDLLRIGTDPERNLTNLTDAAIVLQVSGTDQPITIRYSDLYLTGGYGPDCGETSPPYVYRYRYRSTITGERSNPSPSMRAGIPARRQRVSLTAEGCTESQCDVIDWFKFGGALARWTYVRSADNDTGGGEVTVNDDMADRQIDGGEGLRVDLFQPWPVSDLPRSGTCRVVGTSLERISGDQFNVDWAPDTPILVNGRATSLYGSPTSASRLSVIDNCDAGDPVEWSIPSPTLMARNLGRAWGGYVNNVWFHFACGDPSDPGALHWSHGNDPDASSDANVLAITSASEPLQNGFVDDGVAYVFSTERLFRLEPDFGGIATFRPVETAVTRGLWNPWAFCIGPNGGTYYVAQDGIFVTVGGSAEVSVVDPDLRKLFPRDGSIPDLPDDSCLAAIDFFGPMELSTVNQLIYFDYSTTNGSGATLVCEPQYDHRWTPDKYPEGVHVRSRLEEPGSFVLDNIVGCENGHSYQSQANILLDDGVAIQWGISTKWATGDDPRALKQWGDASIDVDAANSCDGILVTPVVDNGVVELDPTVVGALVDGRETYTVELPDGGILSRNFGLNISGIIQTSDLGKPILFLWEPSWLWKQVPIARRATDWEDLGYKGAKFVQGIVIRANTFGQIKQVSVQYDGGTEALVLPVHHNGERAVAYPKDQDGWSPFTAELVRLVGADDVEWTLLDWRWVFEPAPELATQWETQDTTFDFPGYGSVQQAVLAYQSAIDTTLRVWHGTSVRDYTIPASGSIYRRYHLWLNPQKGLSFRFRWTGDQPFRVFQRDCSVYAQPWGGAAGYTIQQPFGGPSRAAGAEV